MILLEWFTNSCKYGVHSVPDGKLDLGWELIDGSIGQRVRLRWTESGGPTVQGEIKPSLGTELVKGFATRELGGQCELSYPPTGADHVLEFPIPGS